MSDSCFLCLINTRIKQCPQCNLRAHYKCWKKYTDHSGTDCTKCPQCSMRIKKRRPMTREHSAFLANKETIVKHIKSLLTLCATAVNRQQKTEYAIELFDYLLGNMVFVREYETFEKTVRDKLIQLHKLENWEPANDYYFRMFGEIIAQ